MCLCTRLCHWTECLLPYTLDGKNLAVKFSNLSTFTGMQILAAHPTPPPACVVRGFLYKKHCGDSNKPTLEPWAVSFLIRTHTGLTSQSTRRASKQTTCATGVQQDVQRDWFLCAEGVLHNIMKYYRSRSNRPLLKEQSPGWGDRNWTEVWLCAHFRCVVPCFLCAVTLLTYFICVAVWVI